MQPDPIYLAAVKNAVVKPCHVHQRLPKKYQSSHSLRLYSITTIDSYGPRLARTVAVARFPRAKEMVQNNEGDLCEGCTNKLCVIEALMVDVVFGGLLLNETYWYVWSDLVYRYLPIEEPEEYQGIVRWGIG